MSTTRVGLMLVGVHGMTASAVVAGLRAMQVCVIPVRWGVTGTPEFAELPLVDASEIVVGGWDYDELSIHTVLKGHRHMPEPVVQACRGYDLPLYAGLHTRSDYPLSPKSRFVVTPKKASDGIDRVASNIDDFRLRFEVDIVVVVYLGSPSRYTEVKPEPRLDEDTASGVLYALGALKAGAHFVDFTPSQTLQRPEVWNAFESSETLLAGRDGSTGQTILKVTLAESFRRRNIELDSWYSLNLIGNHDGLVLSDPEFAFEKLADKTDALHPQPDQSHKVRIEYVPPWGDAKESWDAVEARSWLGSRVTLRINWRAHDSELAAPLVLDLARLLVHSASLGRTGFQANLGFFFKRPFLRENTSISERWSELVHSFDAQLEK